MIFQHHAMQLSKYTDEQINTGEKKQNKWKEGGCTWVDRLAGDWEEMGASLCLVCARVCLHRVSVCGYAKDLYCTVVLHMCIADVAAFLVAYLMATDLLLGIDSVRVFYRKYFSGEQELFAANGPLSPSIKRKRDRWRNCRDTQQTPTTTKTALEREKQKSSFHTPQWNTCLINHFIINWMLAY